jgi:cbb3-type cytochrome oxidase maturation protein
MHEGRMDILYLLIPLSAVLVLGIVGVFGWAVMSGQFDDLEPEGERVLQHDDGPLDPHQAKDPVDIQESRRFANHALAGGPR